GEENAPCSCNANRLLPKPSMSQAALCQDKQILKGQIFRLGLKRKTWRHMRVVLQFAPNLAHKSGMCGRLWEKFPGFCWVDLTKTRSCKDITSRRNRIGHAALHGSGRSPGMAWSNQAEGPLRRGSAGCPDNPNLTK